MQRVILALAFLAISTFSSAVQAADRVALVIANADYAVGRLDNVASDARRIREALTSLDFDVTLVSNADKGALLDAVDAFAARLSANAEAIGFVYYAGHGLQVDGVNYLVPLRADIRGEHDVEAEAYDVRRLLGRLADADNRANVVVLDACRNNPFRGFFRSPLIGLGVISTPRNTMIAYSTGPNQLAPDNGLYAETLAEELVTPGLYLDRVFRNVANRVDQSTVRAQRPWLQLSVFPDVQLVPPSTSPPPVVQPLAPTMLPQVAQRTLRDLGFDPGPVDGLIGPATSAALGRFQGAQGLPATGRLDAATVAALEAARRISPAPAPVQPAVGVFREHQPGDTFRDCAECPEMVVVPAGSFMMGSPEGEEKRDRDEGPRHRVTIAETFAVGVFEVTFDEWDTCVADGGCDGHRPSDNGWGRGRQPVIDVSWNHAQAYLAWLNERLDLPEGTYRLLSEAEWEYAARAGNESPFHFGPTISTDQANYDGNYTYGSGRKGEYRQRTLPVGSFPPNDFGLHDVHGNVWEWIEDCWNAGYAKAGRPDDGRAWTTGDCSRRVLRGGSWNGEPWDLRSANRFSNVRNFRFDFNGFRVARTLR